MSCGDVKQLISAKTRRVTASFPGGFEQTYGFAQFSEALPELESLSILFPAGWTTDVHRYWRDGSHTSSSNPRRIVTRKLSIEGCMPDSFGAALPYLFDLSRVTKLSLFDCKGEILRHLSGSIELVNLVDFELRTLECFDNETSEDARVLFTKNQNLQHLCLHLSDLNAVALIPEKSPNCTPYLWPLRSKLRILSLFDLSCVGENGEFSYPGRTELKIICNQFSALEQLGLWFNADRFSSAEAEKRLYFMTRYLVSSECFLCCHGGSF
jgi:hypothetical protein